MATKKSTKPDDKPKPKAEPRPDPWERIATAGDLAAYDKIKALVYGGTKQGKTRLCALMGKRPLIGLAEQQGIPTIKRANPNAVIFQIRTPEDLHEFKMMARSARAATEFDAVCLDGITEAQALLRAYYTGRQKDKAGRDKTSMESWGATIDATIRLSRELRDIPTHVLVTALDEEESVDGVGVMHRPAVNGKKLPNQLCAHFNVVGYAHTVEESRGLRRQILFRGNERYLVGAPDWLDDIEPPEPQWWFHRMQGIEVPEDVAERVRLWKEQAKTMDDVGDDDDVGDAADDDDDNGAD